MGIFTKECMIVTSENIEQLTLPQDLILSKFQNISVIIFSIPYTGHKNTATNYSVLVL